MQIHCHIKTGRYYETYCHLLFYGHLDNYLNPSSILSYLGTNGYGNISTGYECDVHINAIPLLGYWDIVKNFYANKQEANAYVYSIEKTFTNGQVTDSGSVLKGTIDNLSLINISVNQNYKIILNHNLGRALTTNEIKGLTWQINIGSVVSNYTTDQLAMTTTGNTTSVLT